MKDIIKYISLFVLIVFSFYYTDKISTIIIYKSNLMKEITSKKSLYEHESINAEILNDTIIPGINGLKVSELDSYYQMKKQNLYNVSKLVYEEVTPDISIENNKKLVINKGRSEKNKVALLIKDNEDVINYSLNKQIKLTRLINFNNFSETSFFEQINIDDNYKKLDILLKKYKIDTNICLVDYLDKNRCIKDNKYLVKQTYSLNNALNLKDKISSGDIIFIDDNMSLVNYKILLKELSYRDLKVDFLSNLISEKLGS